jgi:hypothetical protein
VTLRERLGKGTKWRFISVEAYYYEILNYEETEHFIFLSSVALNTLSHP